MLKVTSVVLLSLLLCMPVSAKMKHKHHHRHHHRYTHVKNHNRHVGMASWYGPGFHGRRTASGERFNQYAMTAAHKTLPLGSVVRVTSLETNKSIIVRINDRGPYRSGFVIDLSKGAASALKMRGAEPVILTLLD